MSMLTPSFAVSAARSAVQDHTHVIMISAWTIVLFKSHACLELFRIYNNDFNVACYRGTLLTNVTVFDFVPVMRHSRERTAAGIQTDLAAFLSQTFFCCSCRRCSRINVNFTALVNMPVCSFSSRLTNCTQRSSHFTEKKRSRHYVLLLIRTPLESQHEPSRISNQS